MPAVIKDNTEAVFVGSWSTTGPPPGSLVGWNGTTLRYTPAINASSPTHTCTWSFTGLAAGTYQIGVTWTPYANRSKKSRYRFGGQMVEVNQEGLPSAGWHNGGVNFQNIGNAIVAEGGTLSVELGNDGPASEVGQNVMADAVLIDSTPAGITRKVLAIGQSNYARLGAFPEFNSAAQDYFGFGLLFFNQAIGSTGLLFDPPNCWHPDTGTLFSAAVAAWRAAYGEENPWRVMFHGGLRDRFLAGDVYAQWYNAGAELADAVDQEFHCPLALGVNVDHDLADGNYPKQVEINRAIADLIVTHPLILPAADHRGLDRDVDGHLTDFAAAAEREIEALATKRVASNYTNGHFLKG